MSRLLLLDTVTHDVDVGFEVELKHSQRMRHVLRRIGDRHEWHDYVALLDVVLDPLLIDRDVAFHEVEAVVLRSAPRACCPPSRCRRLSQSRAFRIALVETAVPMKPFAPRIIIFSDMSVLPRGAGAPLSGAQS